MNNASEIVRHLQDSIPPLSCDAYKGQAGRVGVVGGSESYTGAPYFAAISALRVGCDLVHVFCTKDASPVIKSYSPELIVHALLDSANFDEDLQKHLPSIHSLVIGPGLGRDSNVFSSVRRIIDFAKNKNMPLVFDADALFLLKDEPSLISSYKRAILTPNKVEFARLYKSLYDKELDRVVTVQDVKKVSETLGNVTVVAKGMVDIISNGYTSVICDESGSLRRCGGQGDLLSGSMGVFNYWMHRGEESTTNASLIAAFGACLLTRRCSACAFTKFNRSTVTSDMIAEINNTFSSLFPRQT